MTPVFIVYIPRFLSGISESNLDPFQSAVLVFFIAGFSETHDCVSAATDKTEQWEKICFLNKD